MQLAHLEAQRCGSALLASQHLLLGLVKEDDGVAAHALRRLHQDFDALEAALIASIPAEVPMQRAEEITEDPPRNAMMRAIRTVRKWATSNKLPQTAETNRIVEHAMGEARALRHNYVGTEHLLLGLLDEPQCAAAKVLLAQGLNRDEIRQELFNLLRSVAPPL